MDAQASKQVGRIGGDEATLCLDAATGKEIWKYEYDCPYTVSYAGGPRMTPAIGTS